MTAYVLIFTVVLIAITAVIAVWKIWSRRESRLLKRLEAMIQRGRDGSFSVEKIDETMVSSVENSMSRFLEECSVSQKNLKEQKQKIQTLISDISHQTLTPISNILLYSQMLEERLKGTEDQRSIEAVRQETEKLSFLIDALVKTSRLETGIIRTHVERTAILPILQDITEEVKTRAENKNITIILEDEAQKAGHRELFALCDRKWTGEALFNILDNAVKYTEAGGQVRISAKEYTMFCRIDIADTGAGISEDELPKIFGRFYRSQRTGDEEGIGLGLYLARDIIENQGGYIKVTSKVDSGSTFSVFLNVSKL